MKFEFGADQIVFMLFFAIFWGVVGNVQPRWKAFQFPLMLKSELPNVFFRVILSILLLNVLPIVYFGYILWATNGKGPTNTECIFLSIGKILIQGVIPAFGVFGLYRAWLGIVELGPSWFYKSRPYEMPKEYRHVEPTYRLRSIKNYSSSYPVVDLGRTGLENLLTAFFYLILGGFSPWAFKTYEFFTPLVFEKYTQFWKALIEGAFYLGRSAESYLIVF